MNLYAKKVIEVEKKENHYSLKLANESIDNISESDSYIIKTLITHESNFQFKTWKELVMLQYEQLDFINNKTEIKKKDKTAEIIILYFIIMIIGTISLPIITKDFRTGLLFLIIYISIMGVVVFPAATMMKDLIKKKKRKELSELGKQELRKWMKFKVFIKEYTLVGEKNIEDVVLYEKYIPYALVVGIGKDYTGTIYKIFEKEDFKKLIEDLKNQFVDENFTAY